MKIHVLDCCTMMVSLASTRGQETRPTPTRCLLIEREEGLMLVDTGIGSDDVLGGMRRLGMIWSLAARPIFDQKKTAWAQIRDLGFDPDDVTEVVLTHMDLDHVGGLGDFPNAVAHVGLLEYSNANKRRLPGMQHGRYRPVQWKEHERWNIHAKGSKRWFGIDGATDITADGRIVLLHLPGHSHGHCGVAIEVESDQWLLHAGDAYMLRQQLHDSTFRPNLGIVAFQFGITADRSGHKQTMEHLRRLRDEPNVHIMCAHDPHQEKFAPIATSVSYG
jgi:glyoxylase-like metal-dependent hydrolase (beta-lactamase superfamily II)